MFNTTHHVSVSDNENDSAEALRSSLARSSTLSDFVVYSPITDGWMFLKTLGHIHHIPKYRMRNNSNVTKYLLCGNCSQSRDGTDSTAICYGDINILAGEMVYG